MVKHEGKKYTCSFDNCDRTFNIKQGFYVHEKLHKYQYAYTCETCGKGFMKHDHFEVHCNRYNNVKPFTWDRCGRKFFCKNELKRHLTNTCQHTSEGDVQCPICDKSLKNADCLRNHCNTFHEEGIKFKSLFCKKYSFYKSTIHRHMKGKHPEKS